MNTFSNNQTVTRSTLEQSVARALRFLRTVGIDPSVRAALQQTGFSEDALKKGWSLVLKASAVPAAPAVTATSTSGPIVEATSEVDTWQSTMLVRAHAALRHPYPEQDSYLFENISTGTGPAAVITTSMFLDRLDALESSPERKATRKADHAALALIAERGITKEARKKMRHLVQMIESTPAPDEHGPVADARTEALTEVHAWVQDWSECARTVITRRDQLLRLGIGKRRARAGATPTPTPVSPVAPARIVTPPPAPVALLPPVSPTPPPALVAPPAAVIPPQLPAAPSVVADASTEMLKGPVSALNGKAEVAHA